VPAGSRASPRAVAIHKPTSNGATQCLPNVSSRFWSSSAPSDGSAVTAVVGESSARPPVQRPAHIPASPPGPPEPRANPFRAAFGGGLGVGALGALFSALVGAELSEEVVASLLDPHARGGAVGDPHVVASLAAGLRPLFRTLAVLGLANVVVVAFYPKNAKTWT